MVDETKDMDVEPTTAKSDDDETKKKSSVAAEPSASAETASKYPDMELAQKIHRLTMLSGSKPILDDESAKAVGIDSDGLKKEVVDEVTKEICNPSLYREIKSTLNLDDELFTDDEIVALEEKNKKTAEENEKKVEEAKESAGDMEVLDARMDCARFAAKSLSKDEAIAAYDKVLELPKLSSGKKIDALMECSRVVSFYNDTSKNNDILEKASKLALDGGDWDRRNRLKVYTALDKLLKRDFKQSASLLIDCIATFSCSELCTYTQFIIYTILTNMLHLPRPEIKEKIIDGPEILSVKKDIPEIIQLVNSLYECNYNEYLKSMVTVYPILLSDRFLQPHSGYIMRELHVLGYKQYLDSYKSVTLSSMATSFGVSEEFLDLQLSRFIAVGRLTAKIDKFNGIVETNRPDLKNAQYRDMIQQGDLLLNRIQKLSRVLDL